MKPDFAELKKKYIIMIPQFLILLICFVSAGTDMATQSSAIMVSFKENIKSADINRLTKLINENAEFRESPRSEKHRYDCFRLAVEKGQTSVVDLFLKKLNIDLTLMKIKQFG